MFNFKVFILLTNCVLVTSIYFTKECNRINNEQMCDLTENCIWCNLSSTPCKSVNTCYKNNNNNTDYCNVTNINQWMCDFSMLIFVLVISIMIYVNNFLCLLISKLVKKQIPKWIFIAGIMIPGLMLMTININYLYYYILINFGLFILIYVILTMTN